MLKPLETRSEFRYDLRIKDRTSGPLIPTALRALKFSHFILHNSDFILCLILSILNIDVK